jgi:hypothetical protein
VADIAERLRIKPATWRAFVYREQAPKPDGQYDKRTPWWYARTVRLWDAARPNIPPRRI